MRWLLFIVHQCVQFYTALILIDALISWLPNARQTQFAQLVSSLVDPYVSYFRRVIPPIGGLDCSPVIAILVLNLAQRGLFIFLRMI